MAMTAEQALRLLQIEAEVAEASDPDEDDYAGYVSALTILNLIQDWREGRDSPIR